MTAKNYFSQEYTNASKKQLNICGREIKKTYAHFLYKVSEANTNDTFVLAQNLEPNTIIKSIKNTNGALAAAADNDIMICKHGETSAITVAAGKTNLLADGISLVNASTNSEVLGSNLSNFDYSKSLGELTGINNETFDIVLIVKTKGTTADATIFEIIELTDNL